MGVLVTEDDDVCPLMYDNEAQEPSGWACMDWVTKNGVKLHRHVLPQSDIRVHQLDPVCWCKPRWDEDDDKLLIHNSADGREKYERGESRPN